MILIAVVSFSILVAAMAKASGETQSAADIKIEGLDDAQAPAKASAMARNKREAREAKPAERKAKRDADHDVRAKRRSDDRIDKAQASAKVAYVHQKTHIKSKSKRQARREARREARRFKGATTKVGRRNSLQRRGANYPPATCTGSGEGVEVTTFQGDYSIRGTFDQPEGSALDVSLAYPSCVVISSCGDKVYVTNTGENPNYISEMDLNTGHVSTLVGDGTYATLVAGVGTAAAFDWPTAIVLSTDGNTMYVLDTDDEALCKVDVQTKEMSILADIDDTYLQGIDLHGIAMSPSEDFIYFSTDDYPEMGVVSIMKYEIATGDITQSVEVCLGGDGICSEDVGLAVTKDGSELFVVGHGKVGVFNTEVDSFQIVAGGGNQVSSTQFGDGADARFVGLYWGHPSLSPDDEILYFSDYYGHVVVGMRTSSPYQVFKVAGDELQPGYLEDPFSEARFYNPAGVAVSPDGKYLLVADSDNGVIRKITLDLDCSPGASPGRRSASRRRLPAGGRGSNSISSDGFGDEEHSSQSFEMPR